ncbi:MAG: glycoside hydrolase family 43 protein [Eubacterium sp.]|nr:glycoside hydrolase family 43 protein [Eubacterium sp.]
MNNMIKKILAVALTASITLSGCGAAGGNGETSGGSETENSGSSNVKGVLSVDKIKVGNTSFGISCHDPQIILADDGVYYMTGSHQVIAKSEDLMSWEYMANGNNMFDNIFKGDLEAFKYVGKNEQGAYSIWASNIWYNDVMKKYLMYFCTSSTYIKSSLTLAESDTPGGPYTFTDVFLDSGFGSKEIDQTNLLDIIGKKGDTKKYLQFGGYNNKEWPNCIDPALFKDADGKTWMVYGSWSGGIFLLEIDEKTGLPIHPENDEANGVDAYFGYHLIGGDHHAVEGPYIHYDEESSKYYLFVSCGELQREGGYQIREYRSDNVTGPYVDAKGQTLGSEEDYFNYGVKMIGNYKLPSLETAYMAPGGQSTFTGKDGNLYITFHTRFDRSDEYHEPRVHRLYKNSDGWYVMAPFETGTEVDRPEGYTSADIGGEYHLVQFGFDISSKIRESEAVTFTDGAIEGLENAASYQTEDGTANITLTIDDVAYKGVIIDMVDEAGNNVRCISAAGDNNQTVWAVQYRE